jgi:arylsulfatase A-like enzyme
MYDPLVKVPLVMKLPGNAGKGTRRTDLVSNIDIAPTLLAQAGIATHPFSGKDLSLPSEREYVFAEIGHGLQSMLRSHTRKLILHRNRDMSLYFDLQQDPLEMNNLYADENYRGEIEELTVLLEQAMRRNTVLDEIVGQDMPVTVTAGIAGKDRDASFRWFDERMRSESYKIGLNR